MTMDENKLEAERERQRIKNRKYYKLLLHIYRDRRLIKWLLRGKKHRQAKAVAIKRNLYRIMNIDLNREGP